MKVFISWSGELSRQLAEVFREWLPNALQLVTPYFTPSDIEKGSRWSTDIAKELDESQIGVLCITPDNLSSDWILFEAGALSKSLKKAHVCPILFGVNNANLVGPLRQFQTTSFSKSDFKALLTTINTRLGEQKLPPKTLDTVFEKWWPDLESRVKEILEQGPEIQREPIRPDRELLEELLELSRSTARRTLAAARSSIPPKAIEELLLAYITLHDQQVKEDGGYQDALDLQKEMHKALLYIVKRSVPTSKEVETLVEKLETLSYQVNSVSDVTNSSVTGDDDIPF